MHPSKNDSPRGCRILALKGSEIDYESDLGAQDEVMLTENSDVPVFVEKWPQGIKAFYMKETQKMKTTCSAQT